ncbi:hypothetical protein O3G_MSEX004755 [Manduca sexta]|nr:hypothetical protein O3G_MSEX004755 [Manduca sexta]
MVSTDIQLSHTQVLLRSSFCRKVMSACFILERVEGLIVEHQWENFVFSFAPEGWRAKYHIYSPGMKPGGGQQHRPGLSKTGCYLVRLFYLGAWRCVWVSDQVPVDATGSPLLPFSPLSTHTTTAKPGMKPVPTTVTANEVYLWPLLLCKALLKLAAPDMNSDEDTDSLEDEAMPEFDIMHSLTGGVNLTYNVNDLEELWYLITSEIPVFAWDDDDDTLTSTVKSKSTKKVAAKETTVVKRGSMVYITIGDTKNQPPYALPGITPGHEMTLLATMARDLPLKKPLPEPEVAYWKYYRWVDWARRHGLYEAYDCPRTRFLKVNGLLKLSYAPHLLDVQSTESITFGFREEHDKTNAPVKKNPKDLNRSNTAISAANQQLKEEMREWIQFDPLKNLVKQINMLYYPSMYEFTSASSNPPIRITKGPPNKAIDIAAPKSAPLYLQIDGPEENELCISLNVLHPRVLFNCGVPVVDYIEPGYLIMERFEWFVDSELPVAKAFVATRGYDSVEVKFQPGRHFCRIWVHSRMNWHMMLLSESTLLLGTRDVIQCAAVRECPWAAKFLTALGIAFTNWTRINRSNPNITATDREFYKSYLPDLAWDPEMVGYDIAFVHWMFRQALQSLLLKRLQPAEHRAVCMVLRRYLCDPDFGLPPKPLPPKSLRNIIDMDPCDCLIPESEEIEITEAMMEEQAAEEKSLVDPITMEKLLTPPTEPVTSQICELATEELPCGILKDEREKVVKKHEAATYIQAHWRGTWARKCLTSHYTFTADVMKSVMENAFGNLDVLSALMNEFFAMYPGTKYAYSVASALSGVHGLQQHSGATQITPKCKWIPYFQGVFYCHAPVKVHFDVHSTLQYSTLAVYNNDTGMQLPQVYNAHITFDFSPNNHGYTVMGHGTLAQVSGTYYDCHWQLTVLSSTNDIFHICDNDFESCKEMSLPAANKLHVDEIFIPNRRNILGGIQISVSKYEAVSFRVAATSPDLEMVAVLRTQKTNGEVEELARCCGKGEINWPYLRLKPSPPPELNQAKKRSTSQSNLSTAVKEVGLTSARSLKSPAKPAKPTIAAKNKSSTKLKDQKGAPVEPKQYTIQVIAPTGWPLTLAQWVRVDEVRNSHDYKLDIIKKPAKEKVTSAKDKDKVPSPVPGHQPQPGDAYVELECTVANGGGAVAKRDDERDIEFATARKMWDANEPGRNARGAQIRKEFRAEFLEALPPPPSDSVHTLAEEGFGEEVEGEEVKKEEPQMQTQQGPTPATESGLLEMTVESEEEAKYLTMPEQLKDKFIPLYFLPFCMKEKDEELSVLLTPDMTEAAKKERHTRIESAMERMRELQLFNETHVLGRQKCRSQLLERLYVDSQWSPELLQVLEERDDAIARETLNRTLSATKKKQDSKKK